MDKKAVKLHRSSQKGPDPAAGLGLDWKVLQSQPLHAPPVTWDSPKSSSKRHPSVSIKEPPKATSVWDAYEIESLESSEPEKNPRRTRTREHVDIDLVGEESRPSKATVAPTQQEDVNTEVSRMKKRMSNFEKRLDDLEAIFADDSSSSSDVAGMDDDEEDGFGDEDAGFGDDGDDGDDEAGFGDDGCQSWKDSHYHDDDSPRMYIDVDAEEDRVVEKNSRSTKRYAPLSVEKSSGKKNKSSGKKEKNSKGTRRRQPMRKGKEGLRGAFRLLRDGNLDEFLEQDPTNPAYRLLEPAFTLLGNFGQGHRRNYVEYAWRLYWERQLQVVALGTNSRKGNCYLCNCSRVLRYRFLKQTAYGVESLGLVGPDCFKYKFQPLANLVDTCYKLVDFVDNIGFEEHARAMLGPSLEAVVYAGSAMASSYAKDSDDPENLDDDEEKNVGMD